MTTVVTSKWKLNVNGSYATAADWTPSGVPNYGAGFEYNVFIGGSYLTGTTPIIVTSAVNEQVDFLQISDAKTLQAGPSGVTRFTLSITGGKFLVYSHNSLFSNLYNFGTINVSANAVLAFGVAGGPSSASGEIENVGSIAIAGTMSLAAPWFGLLGKGTLTLSGKIVGANTGAVATLYNDNSTIQGSGYVGTGAALYLNNGFAGVIDANAAARMTINTGTNRINNAGTIESTEAGGLTIDSSMQLDGALKVTGTGALSLDGAVIEGGGTITVGAKSVLVLANSEVSMGGVISIGAGGQLRTTSGNTTGIGADNNFAGDALQDAEILIAGAVAVENDSTLNLNATLYGAGAVDLLGATGPTRLEIFGNGLAIRNTGGISLSNSAENAIVSNGAGESFSNYTRITGAGAIGDTWLRLVNHPGATIDADDGDSLTLVGDTSAVGAGTEKENYNDGTLIDTGSGGLILSGGALNNAGYLTQDGVGVLTLNGANVDSGGGFVRAEVGDIVLKGNSQIYNQGEVFIYAGGKIETTAGDTNDALFNDVSNSGAVNVVAGSTFDVSGNWLNSGAISVGSSTAGASVDIQAGSAWQLLGAGTLNLSSSADSILSAGANTYFADTSNLITGGGTIGDANMSVNIQAGGKVDATLASGLTLDATAQNSSNGHTYLYNAGVLQSDSAGGLILDAAIYSPGQLIVDAGASIVANDAVYGSGVTTINGTGSVEFHADANNDVYFGAAKGGDLILDNSHAYYGTTYGFAAGDTVDFRDFAFVAGKTAVDQTTSGFGSLDAGLILTNGTTDSTSLWLQGDYTSATLAADHLAFQFSSDGHLINGTSSDGTLIKLVSTT